MHAGVKHIAVAAQEYYSIVSLCTFFLSLAKSSIPLVAEAKQGIPI
jgi:hypothetical protein